MSGTSVLRRFAFAYLLPSANRGPLRTAFGIVPLFLLAAMLQTAQGQTVKIERCDNPSHTLPAGDKDTDLQVTNGNHCIVDGSVTDSTYTYRNVNIWNGTLTFRDRNIDFHAHSILVENGGTLEAGLETPVSHFISIWLWGDKTDGIPSIACLSGETCGVPEAIWKSNPNVVMKEMPHQGCKAASDFGPSPVGKDCFYQYEDLDGDDAHGSYFGRKTLAVSYGGTLILRGRKGIREGPIAADPSDSSTSWVRLTDTLNDGNTTFHVDRDVPTWSAGDHLVITSTDYLPSHSEEVVIRSVENDGRGARITLQAGVKAPHNGKAYDFREIQGSAGPKDDPNGPKTLPSRHVETRAAVALLTRNIMIASEGGLPLKADRSKPHFTQGYYGGHTLIREGVKQYQVQGVEYYQLGQGGALGRYPVHFHMDRTVPQPSVEFQGTYIADSSIHDSNTRFITIHATQGLLIARNVGYQSIGHGFYLEDATEINNRLYSNIGIQARAAVDDDLNPRRVPGILSQPGNGEKFPFHSDFDHPSVYWIMNTWNDLRYNVAVGAGTCGACYWMPPSANSGSSVYETWDSYASMQTPGREGTAPFLNFVGNMCSTAMNAIETVGNTNTCLGVNGEGGTDQSRLNAIPNPEPIPDNRYPVIGGGQREHATLCDAAHQSDCSKVPICTGDGPNEANCAATVIDHFTSSFTWAQKNFAAIWLRGWWFLVTDSAITDAQGGGLTFVTGGGYTRSDAAQGFWSLSHRNIYVGNTQPNMRDGIPANAAASNAGPFNPRSLTCPYNPAFCISRADGISFQGESFNAQRLLNIYDGPSFEDSDAFADVHVTNIGTLADCKPDPSNPQGDCAGLKWFNGFNTGVLQNPPTQKGAKNSGSNACILPNAAIGWKQPNGFYYPPAFHSTNLAFHNVDIRHFVVQPLWLTNTFTQNEEAVRSQYCTWQPTQFLNFTDVDRQTELTDDNGSLTGLTSNTEGMPEASISVTRDPFFRSPLVTPECESAVPGLEATVDTSPYQYVTTALYTPCGKRGGSCTRDWGWDCGSQSCYGVPLYRQYLTDAEFRAYEENRRLPEIRMQGQGTGQRSNMTLNHGSYYIDTTVPADEQRVANPNVFLAGQSYYLYFLYATSHTRQTYSMYIGKVNEQEGLDAVTPGRVGVNDANYTFSASPGGNWISKKTYDPHTGLLTVTIDLSQQEAEFENDREQFCRPQSYCSYKSATRSCGCRPGSNCKEDSVCSSGVKDVDCPIAGCFAVSVKMPNSFVAQRQPGLPPVPIHYTGDPESDPFFRTGNVTFENASREVAGSCHYPVPPMQR